MKRLLSLLAAAMVAALPAKAATFLPINHYKAIVMTGDTKPGDETLLRSALLFANTKGTGVERVFLNSTGGPVDPALGVAAVIAEFQLDTVIGRTDECYSSCAIVFSAGKHRVVFQTSKIGVHAAVNRYTMKDGSVGPGIEDENAMAYTIKMARLLKQVGVPMRVIGKLVTTPPSDIAMLDGYDFAEWGVEIIK